MEEWQKLRKFGITMGAAFAAISLIILLRQRQSAVSTSVVSAVFLILTLMRPHLLKPAYIIWMKLAFVLNWVNTRLILIILFYVVFTPLGIVLRLFRVDALERRIEKDRDSYWKEKEKQAFNPVQYEKQF